jgi:hypothetical protein
MQGLVEVASVLQLRLVAVAPLVPARWVSSCSAGVRASQPCAARLCAARLWAASTGGVGHGLMPTRSTELGTDPGHRPHRSEPVYWDSARSQPARTVPRSRRAGWFGGAECLRSAARREEHVIWCEAGPISGSWVLVRPRVRLRRRCGSRRAARPAPGAWCRGGRHGRVQRTMPRSPARWGRPRQV